MGDVKATIQAKISGKKVMVFSKSSCPYCLMAKKVFKKYVGKELPASEYEVWEIERDPKCQLIQSHLRKMTGASSVSLICISFFNHLHRVQLFRKKNK